jgi:hypothetical protein
MDPKKVIANKLYPLGYLGGSIFYLFLKSFYLYRKILGDKRVTRKKYKKIYHREPNLDKPETLNEKILWLKLNDRRPIHTLCADKYTVRDYLKKKFGEKYLIPLLYVTDNWRDLTFDVIPDEKCIIKASHSQGDMLIVKDKSKVDIKKLRYDARIWLMRNLYYETQEWQYKNCKPRIIIEKLLQDKEGHIPNDYKLHYINGRLEFVYCSVGRETVNKRNIYDANWNPLYFSWVEPYKDVSSIRGEEIPAPQSFEEMKRIGTEIAKEFPQYVRVDFYDVDGKLYFGEITFHHGSGFDLFTPSHYDEDYGKLIKI